MDALPTDPDRADPAADPAPAPDPDTAADRRETGAPRVTVVGGGQLARMMAAPAAELGIALRVLAERADDPAAQVLADVQVGGPGDAGALARAASGADALTFDHEHVPGARLDELEGDGVAVRPGAGALRHAQDKLVLRERLAASGVPGPAWAAVRDVAGLRAFGDEAGWPVVLKTPRGGYDGHGVRVVGADEVAGTAGWFERAGADGSDGRLLVEERVPFERELAVVVARSPSGQASAWPVVQTIQVDGICREVLAPAPGLDADVAAEATATALRLADKLGVVGVMAMECFEVAATGRTEPGAAAVAGSPGGSRVLVNELAMRPHNSGHWSMDGAVTGQFEQHLRAVLDLPLGDVSPLAPWTVMVNVLGPQRAEHADLHRALLHVMAHDPGVKVHLYGKAWRPGRKMGHVNVSGADLEDVRARARHAGDFLTGLIDG